MLGWLHNIMQGASAAYFSWLNLWSMHLFLIKKNLELKFLFDNIHIHQMMYLYMKEKLIYDDYSLSYGNSKEWACN